MAVVLSQLTRQQIQIPSKGDAFEADVLAKFKAAGISAKGFKFVINGESYQCDVAVLWDDCLFVIECKNYLLPPENPASEFYFLTSLNEAAVQVSRTCSALQDHPEIVSEHFGEDVCFKEVYKIVLNAMPFCYPRHETGVFFYDASALTRFLGSGDITISQTMTVDGLPRRFDHRVGSLWSGSTPNAKDLIRQLRDPIQYVLEQERWSVEQFGMPLSDNWVLSKPQLKRQQISLNKVLEASGWSEDGIVGFSNFIEKLAERLSDKKTKS